MLACKVLFGTVLVLVTAIAAACVWATVWPPLLPPGEEVHISSQRYVLHTTSCWLWRVPSCRLGNHIAGWGPVGRNCTESWCMTLVGPDLVYSGNFTVCRYLWEKRSLVTPSFQSCRDVYVWISPVVAVPLYVALAAVLLVSWFAPHCYTRGVGQLWYALGFVLYIFDTLLIMGLYKSKTSVALVGGTFALVVINILTLGVVMYEAHVMDLFGNLIMFYAVVGQLVLGAVFYNTWMGLYLLVKSYLTVALVCVYKWNQI
jgi:hypothetical protein